MVLKRQERHEPCSACVFSNTNNTTNGDVYITVAVAIDSPSNIRVGWTWQILPTSLACELVTQMESSLIDSANCLGVWMIQSIWQWHPYLLFVILISNTCVCTETALKMSSDKINCIGQKTIGDHCSTASYFTPLFPNCAFLSVRVVIPVLPFIAWKPEFKSMNDTTISYLLSPTLAKPQRGVKGWRLSPFYGSDLCEFCSKPWVILVGRR